MKNRSTANNKVLLALNLLVTRIKADVTGKTITSIAIDNVTGEMVIYYTDGTDDNLGVVKGNDGDPGAGVLDLQLFEDPDSPGDVFLQTTLTNGIVLRTRDSLKGWDGKGLDSAYVSNNNIHFVLDDGLGTELPPIPVSGLTAISINGASVVDGDLIFSLTNGQTINAGLAADLKGRGITDLTITDGNLIITFSDNPAPVNLGKVVGTSVVGTRVENGNLIFELSNGTELDAGSAEALKGRGIADVKLEGGKVWIKYTTAPEWVEIAGLDGVDRLEIIDGKLQYAKSSDPATLIELAPFQTIVGMEVVGNVLWALTNQPAPDDKIELGPVANLKGDPGVGIRSAAIVNNVLTLTLTNDAEIDLPVDGLAPVIVTGARYDAVEDEIYFILGNGTEIPSGIKEDMRGEGLTRVEVTADGKLNVYYDRAPDTAEELAVIKYLTAFYVQDGKIWAKYNTTGDVPQELGTILGVANIVNEAGVVKVKYTDGTEAELGNFKGVKSISINETYQMVITYSDDTTQVVGNVRGPKGEDGRGIVGAVIDESGDLILSTTDGSSLNAGQARIDIDNMIGSVKRFVATAGQDEYIVAHSGEAAVFVDGALRDESTIDLATGDRVKFNPALVGGEKVVVMAFAPTGTVITGKGIQAVAETSAGIYEITLENGVKYSINTVTPIDPNALPPRITGMTINQESHLIITFDDASTMDAGFTANANSITNAKVDNNGDLIITLTDTTTINCGSVMSNLAITSAVIDENGHLIITMNSGGTFDAGPTGAYVVSARIDPTTGELILTLNTAVEVNAGAVVNPLLGVIHDFTAFAGQTEFPVAHAGHRVLFFANSSLLSDASIDTTTDPNKIIVRTPREADDIIRILLLSTGGMFVKGLQAEATAENETFYGVREGVAGFYPLGSTKVSTPLDFVANPGQAVFNNIPHNGLVEVFVGGMLVTTGFNANTPTKVIFDIPFVGGEVVRINALNSPNPLDQFRSANFCRIANKTYQNGGTFTPKTWQTRQLNVLEDNAIGAMLNKNNIILPAGQYYIRGWVASFGVLANAVRLYSNSERKVILNSSAQYSEGMSKTFIEGYFSFENQSSLALQHYGVKGVATFGLGKCGDGSSTAAAVQTAMGVPMTHVELNVWRVG